MPEAVAEVEQMRAMFARQRLAVLAEVGDVVQSGGEPVVFLFRHGAAAGIFALAEIAREGELLLVGYVLVAEQQHGVFVHAGFDVGGLLRRQRLPQVDAGDFAKEMRVNLPDRHGHDVPPGRDERSWPRSVAQKTTPWWCDVNASQASGLRYALRAISPPSTGITAPVRKDAAGRHRLSVMCATSSGSP